MFIKNQKHSLIITKTISIILTLIIILLILAVLILALLLNKSEQKIVETLAQIPEEKTTSIPEGPDLEQLFNTDTNAKIFFNDSALGEVWIPLLENVPLNQYEQDNYIIKNGLKYYYENNKLKSFAGIDVSVHQKDIDWEKVSNAGIDFAMIRVGFRGYQTGDVHLDENYKKNIEGAIDAGLNVGVYFFSQAITVNEAIEEAKLTIDAIKDYEITYPVVFDWEIIYNDVARTDELSVNMLTNITIAFCETIKNHGYTPMVYSNRKQAYLKLELEKLTDYDFWLAEFNPTTNYKYYYQMWQYSCTGSVDGIDGNVDLNICFKDYKEIYKKENEKSIE